MNDQIWTTRDILKAIAVSLIIGFVIGFVVGYETGYTPVPVTWKPLIG